MLNHFTKTASGHTYELAFLAASVLLSAIIASLSCYILCKILVRRLMVSRRKRLLTTDPRHIVFGKKMQRGSVSHV
uniref:Transmembrane protein n=1 Tax=Steinernema glaseri TaxID=37863 RepID=A0A1I7YCA6_9BILA